MAETLKVEGLSHFYQDGDRQKFVLKDVTYEFQTGTFYAIVGASGSGKTTFLSLISGLDTVKKGIVSLNGHNIEDIGLENYRSSRVGIVFQAYNLIKYLTARENVLIAMETTTNKMPKDKDKVVANLLNYLGITKDKINRPVNQLSGGEQQRVAIARALASDVNFIFADEPTGNLDEETEEEIINIFQELAHQHNKCVIVVTHSQEVASRADTILTLKKGEFISE